MTTAPTFLELARELGLGEDGRDDPWVDRTSFVRDYEPQQQPSKLSAVATKTLRLVLIKEAPAVSVFNRSFFTFKVVTGSDLQESGEVVQCDVRPADPVFVYTCQVSSLATLCNAPHNATARYKLVSCTRQKLPLTERVARELLTGLVNDTALGRFMDTYRGTLFSSGPATIESLRAAIRQESAFAENILQLFDQRPMTKRYVACLEINVLAMYFDREALEALKTREIRTLFWKLTNTPYQLCFRSQLPRITQPSESGRLSLFLQELTLEQASRAFYACEKKPQREAAVHTAFAAMIYEKLKHETLSNMQSFATRDQLLEMEPRKLSERRELNDHELTEADVDAAFRELLRLDGAKLLKNGAYQLSCVNDAERGLMSALHCILTKSPRDDYVPRRFSELTVPLNEMFPSACAEQLRALEIIRDSPVAFIDGTAGSGKTQIMAWLTQILDPECILSTAATAAACDNLTSRMQTLRAFNNHLLWFAHKDTCGVHAPSDKPADLKRCDRTKIPYLRCIFERIHCVIVEEASLAHPSTLAALLLHLVLCGNVSSIIFIGDRNQLQPLRQGSMWRELLDLFANRGSIHFKENHRAKGTSAHKLVENSRQIIYNNAQNMIVEDDGANSAMILHPPSIVSFADRANTQLKYEMASRDIEGALALRPKLGEYEVQFITGMNDLRYIVSNALDAYYLKRENRLPQLPPGANELHELSTTYYSGRKIACSKNLNEYGLTNGTIFRIVAFEWVQFSATENINQDLWYLKTSPHFNMRHVRMLLTPAQEARRDELLRDCEAMRGGVRVVTVDNSAELMPQGMHGDDSTLFIVLQPLSSIVAAANVAADSPVAPPIQFLRVPFNAETRMHFRKGGCATVHSFQGRESPHIVVFAPFFCKFLTREWLYTASSRPQLSALYIAERVTLERAAKNPEPTRRCSLALMWEEIEAEATLKRKHADGDSDAAKAARLE
jgi:hypothetical protein